MTPIRFALAVAFSRDRRALWRQVSVLAGSFVACAAFLLAFALPGSSSDAYQHGVGRSPIYTDAAANGGIGSSREGAAIAIVSRGTLADGRQVPTVWLRPLAGHEHDPAVVPPGLRELPAPGEAVLSPGLVESGVSAESLGWKTSRAGSGTGGSVGDDGLMTASEPLIYVRPTAGRTLGEGGAVYYARGFGPGQPGALPAFAPDPEALSPRAAALGSIGVLILPGLVCLVSSARARSAVRDHRLALMTALGVREAVARTIIATEAGSLALVGASVGAIAYSLVITANAVPIPGTSITLLAGALRLPWYTCISVIGATAAIAAAVSASGRIRARWAPPARRAPRKIWAAALAAGLAAVIVSATPSNPLALLTATPGEAAFWLFAAGTLTALVATPLAVPWLCFRAGSAFSGSTRPTIWATSRRIRHDARHLARIPAVLATLIVIASTATAVWSAAVLAQQEGAGPSRTAVDLSWRDPRPNDVARAQTALARAGIHAAVLPAVPQDDSNGPVPRAVHVPDCRTFVTLFAGRPAELCGTGRQEQLAAFTKQHTGTTLAVSGPDVIDGSTAATIVSPDPIDVARVQELLGWLPGINVDLTAGDLTQPYPAAQWAIAAGLTALLLLGLTAVREIGDRSIEDSARDRTYLRLGLSASAVDRLAWASLVGPLVVSLTASVLISAIIAYAGSVSSITHGDFGRLLVVALSAFGLTVATCAVTVVVRHASHARKE